MVGNMTEQREESATSGSAPTGAEASVGPPSGESSKQTKKRSAKAAGVPEQRTETAAKTTKASKSSAPEKPSKAAKTAKTAKKTSTEQRARAGTGERRRRMEDRASALLVRPDEDAWSPDELEAVATELQAEADRLRAEIKMADSEFSDLLWSPGDGAGDDQADAGSRTFEREHEMSLNANARDLLLQVERAFDRIADGTYGNCERCGNPIGKARLQAFPRATLCVSCKQREERR